DAFLLAHVRDQGRIPVGHARLDAELAFPAGIEQVLVAARQLVLPHHLGVVGLYPEREIGRDPAAMRAERPFEELRAVRWRDRLEDFLAIERLHLERGGMDGIDVMAAGGRFGHRALQDFLGGGAPYLDLDAGALLERAEERRQILVRKARVERQRAFLARRGKAALGPIGALVAKKRGVLGERRGGKRGAKEESEPAHRQPHYTTPREGDKHVDGNERESQGGEVLQAARAAPRAGPHQYAPRAYRQHVGDAQGLRLGRRERPARPSARGPYLRRAAGQGALLRRRWRAHGRWQARRHHAPSRRPLLVRGNQRRAAGAVACRLPRRQRGPARAAQCPRRADAGRFERKQASAGGLSRRRVLRVSEVLVSADSHVMEPVDLWKTRVPERYREAAPLFPPHKLGEGFQQRQGGHDPHARIKEMEVDGLSAEVLYPTLMLGLFGLHDAGLQEACFRAYNDWLLEYCTVDRDRLIGIAAISVYDIEHAIAELTRCRKAGLRGAIIWQAPHPDLPFHSSHYDRFWAAAQDLEAPVSMHILTGH